MLSGDDARDPVIGSNGGSALIAAWERTTGAPIEVTTRDGSGLWAAPLAISGRDARDPAVAVAPDGSGYLAWQGYRGAGRRVVMVVTRGPRAAWGRPRIVSDTSADAREPQLAVDGAGRATLAWIRDVGTSRGTVEVAVQDEDGTWGPPIRLGEPGKPRHLRLSISPAGPAAVVWEDTGDDPSTVRGALRNEAGDWTAVSRVSRVGVAAVEPAVVMTSDGTATAVWMSERGDEVTADAARAVDGAWSEPVSIDRGDARAREMPRPGRVDTAPALAALPDGTVVAGWSIFDGADTVTRAALGTPAGGWSSPRTLSAPGNDAGGIAVASRAGAAPVAAWEEIDGGLLRVRTAVLDPAGDCVDLADAGGERGGVRLGGGAAATAVFMDLNRGRIVAGDVP